MITLRYRCYYITKSDDDDGCGGFITSGNRKHFFQLFIYSSHRDGLPHYITAWMSVRFFSVKISKNHTLRTSLRGGTLVLPHSGGCAVIVRHLVLHRYFGYSGSRECRRPIVDVGTIVMCLVNLGVYRRSKGH